jgi:hypothetical protein
MLRQTITNVRVDLSESHPWIPEIEVVLPALQMPVQALNQLRDRLAVMPMIGLLVQLLPFPHANTANRALAGRRSNFVQAVLPVRPIRSTVVTRFLATVSLSDSRPGPPPWLCIPLGRWFRLPFPALPGLPGSSTDLSLRAVPNHPGRSGECLLVASPPVAGFIILGRLATFT